MFLDENFDIYTMEKSVFDLVCCKFKMTGKQHLMNNESIEDMTQEWFLRKCRLGNTSFIKFQPYETYKYIRYNNEFVSDVIKGVPIYEFIEGENNRQEHYTEINSLYDTIFKRFGETICDLFFNDIMGYTYIELSEQYNLSESTVNRRIRKVRKWLSTQ